MPFMEFDSIRKWVLCRFRCIRLTDPATITAVASDLQKRLHGLPIRGNVCISFDGVEFASSQIIGLLLMARDMVESRHGTLVLCEMGPHVREVLKLTKVERLFTIMDTAGEVIGKQTVSAGRTWSDGGVDWLD